MAEGDLTSLGSLNQAWSQISEKVAQTGHQVKHVSFNPVRECQASKLFKMQQEGSPRGRKHLQVTRIDFKQQQRVLNSRSFWNKSVRVSNKPRRNWNKGRISNTPWKVSNMSGISNMSWSVPHKSEKFSKMRRRVSKVSGSLTYLKEGFKHIVKYLRHIQRSQICQETFLIPLERS